MSGKPWRAPQNKHRIKPFQPRSTHIVAHVNAAHAERPCLTQDIDGEMLVAVLLQGLRCDPVGGKGLRHLLNGALILIQFKLVLIGSIHGFLPMSTAFMRRLEHKSRGCQRSFGIMLRTFVTNRCAFCIEGGGSPPHCKRGKLRLERFRLKRNRSHYLFCRIILRKTASHFCWKCSRQAPMARAIMFQGTGSDVGKSVLVAGLCRVARNRGLKVRPFKPQNMSNNAAVSDDGGEIGRAQWLQALACGVPSSVHMNPVLLKPQTDMGSQLIVQGQVRGEARGRYYQELKPQLMAAVMESLQRLVTAPIWCWWKARVLRLKSIFARAI